MNTGSTSRLFSHFNAIQQQGFEQAQQKYSTIREANPVKADRYKKLTDTYAKYAGIFEHTAENFYPANYFSRGMDRDSGAKGLIETANEAKGILDGLIVAMAAEAQGNARLTRNFDRHASKHVCIINNLDNANEVYRTRGANLTTDDPVGPMDIARLLVVGTGFSMFGRARPA